MVTLDRIREPEAAELYPRGVLEGCATALVLFAAAFHGKQDAVWIADAGLQATCVDIDHLKLGQMMLAYPEDWEFVNEDVFEYVQRTEQEWDVVSIDCPTNLFDRCAQLLPLWSLMARKAIVLGTDDRDLKAPFRWQQTERRFRSKNRGGIYWAVLERDDDQA